jgi:hypothetical protein
MVKATIWLPQDIRTLITSFAQRVQIHLAKSRQFDRVLKFTNRRNASAREDDDTRMLVGDSARSTLRRKGIGRLMGLSDAQHVLVIRQARPLA